MPSLIKFPYKAWLVRLVMNWYPPYIGAGIKITHLADDYRSATSEMALTWYNRNIVGTQFGGSLYSMCDPIYMVMFMHVLGKEYIVWDKSASIEYVSPGKSTVIANFKLDDVLMQSIKTLQPGEKRFETLEVEVIDKKSNKVVARLSKTLYIKRKLPRMSTPVDGGATAASATNAGSNPNHVTSSSSLPVSSTQVEQPQQEQEQGFENKMDP
uniref:DUF4442 domain-containing protein n=1 Tax=Craspedostauros australis TaxID=1486917 RepID=A0A7R9X0E9_9STRA|mmetsp:Transcript_5044/g.13412  ORF Transcript_5044/g.13412 Transcript_5044/m.13412 type:complete len:212 (+) Transcript_5044:621-1256(+)|eukprot:CAMPEP_0198115240 /NCGR_PEP_ID=MMETSP1442-20131203/6408_1 /TAXON_ID= /ORGANISM="Craspedostauros australis, Strain CCMP3328" /LENGTH=211 /DNA_ID=CAMNT_0043772717 /DNA_START=583 /DNA_END=1218 /DNA_ORIENTATION=+